MPKPAQIALPQADAEEAKKLGGIVDRALQFVENQEKRTREINRWRAAQSNKQLVTEVAPFSEAGIRYNDERLLENNGWRDKTVHWTAHVMGIGENGEEIRLATILNRPQSYPGATYEYIGSASSAKDRWDVGFNVPHGEIKVKNGMLCIDGATSVVFPELTKRASDREAADRLHQALVVGNGGFRLPQHAGLERSQINMALWSYPENLSYIPHTPLHVYGSDAGFTVNATEHTSKTAFQPVLIKAGSSTIRFGDNTDGILASVYSPDSRERVHEAQIPASWGTHVKVSGSLNHSGSGGHQYWLSFRDGPGDDTRRASYYNGNVHAGSDFRGGSPFTMRVMGPRDVQLEKSYSKGVELFDTSRQENGYYPPAPLAEVEQKLRQAPQELLRQQELDRLKMGGRRY